MKLWRDEVALAYDDAGTGTPPLVLVHGWAADRSVLRPLFDHARATNRVIAVDLRGHGESDAPHAPDASAAPHVPDAPHAFAAPHAPHAFAAPDVPDVPHALAAPDASAASAAPDAFAAPHAPNTPYTIAAFADDVAFVIAALGLDPPIVIGHSMGGLVALDLAARHGDLVAGAVILESIVIAPPPVLAGLQPLLDGVRRNDRDLLARMMRYLAAGCDEPTREHLVRLATDRPQHVLAPSLADMLAYDSAAAAARVTCQLLYVGTATTYADLDQLRALCPQLVTRQLAGCGHYFPLEAPAQLHPIIDGFVRELAGSR